MSGRAKSFRTYNLHAEGGVGFLFVGNRLCLDFVNTRVIEHGKPADYLQSGTDVGRWLKAAGAGTAEGSPRNVPGGARLLREARTLRHALERMARQLAAGRPVPRSSVAAINRVLRARREHLQLVRTGGGFHTARQSETGDTLGLLAPVAFSAARLLTEDDPSRVRRCRNPACILYFYDTTRSRTRRWCSMQTCGNRLKVAAHRRRSRRSEN
ncbi:MAG TPA: ABATE domain-containing protein [Terriglobales bacterium]|nr:ABATE domain-containing protein [Terriglobales bacterium]